jgi:hypothetical protein
MPKAKKLPKYPTKPKKPTRAQVEFLRKHVDSIVFRRKVRVENLKRIGKWPINNEPKKE